MLSAGLCAKRTVHLLADRYVRGKEGRVEYNSSDSVPQGGREGGTKGETDRASCAEDKFSERANVEEEEEEGMVIWLERAEYTNRCLQFFYRAEYIEGEG